LDTRLVLGVLLVLISVVVGAKVVAGADRSVQVIAASRDLAVGTTLQPADVHAVKVRLFGNAGRYVLASGSHVSGYVVLHAIGKDEFVANAALGQRAAATTRLVTVPVASHHFPDGLGHGDRVDVYLTPKTRDATNPATPALVLSAVPVQSVFDANGSRLSGTGEAGVVLQVSQDDAQRAVQAAESGAIDLLRVPQ
jgi:Flp pilus assembly protein CpaB